MLNNQKKQKTTASERKLAKAKAIELLNCVLLAIDNENSFLDADNAGRYLNSVKSILAEGADPSLCVKTPVVACHTNAIIIAAGSASQECLRILLASPLANANVFDTAGDCALIYAVEKGETDQLRQLLPFADVNLQHPRSGDTALMMAIQYENFEACKILIPGSDLSISNVQGATAIALAESSTVEIRDFFQAEADRLALEQSCPRGSPKDNSTQRLRL